MQYVELPSDLIITDSPDRPEGLHVSTIIGDMCKKLYPDIYGKPLNAAKINSGVNYEQFLEKAFKQGVTFRPPPIKRDGIWLSPDGLSPEKWQVEEYKLTWYSLHTWDLMDKRAWPWMVQIKAYCYALESTKARLWAMFVNGTYRPPSPVLKVWEIEFSPLELLENWSMLLNHAKSVGLL